MIPPVIHELEQGTNMIKQKLSSTLPVIPYFMLTWAKTLNPTRPIRNSIIVDSSKLNNTNIVDSVRRRRLDGVEFFGRITVRRDS